MDVFNLSAEPSIRAEPCAAARRWPSDTTYARLQWAWLIVAAVLIVYGFFLSRFIPTPRWVGFRIVVGLILTFNLLWWSVADRRFARHLCSSRLSATLRASALIFSTALNTPIGWMLVVGRAPDYLLTAPTWYTAAVMIWHMALVTLMPIVAALRLAWLSFQAGARRVLRRDRDDRWRMADKVAVDADRRAMLGTAFATFPMIALGAATGTARAQERRLVVHKHALPAPWLPERLRGLTLTHISDLHVGRHYRPWMLPEMVDKANALGGDIVVVTGDVVDMSNDVLPPAIDALKQLEHRHGIFVCIGNHDEIDSRPDFVRYTRRHLPLLINERRMVAIGGERVTIAGVDYSRDEEPHGRRGGFLADVDQTLAGHSAAQGPVIALAHHPHTWDVLGRRGVPLTLSGHTHGGQIMFTPPDERPDVGLGNLLFRYNRGFYHRDGTTLFVNSGVGNWFPLRLHAPAEIVQLQLV